MKTFSESGRRKTPLLLGVLVLLATPVGSGSSPPSLVRIEVDRPLVTLGVPVLAHFQDGAGREYVLSRVPVGELEAAGIAYTMVDPDASGALYLVALALRPGGREEAVRRERVLLDDGRRLIVRADTRRAEWLATLGFAVARLPERPVRLRTLAPTEYTAGLDPGVEAMIAEVDEVTVWDYNGNLSGENAVTIKGSAYTIATRHSASGEPIQQAVRYVHGHLKSLGLEASFQRWSDEGSAGRNVIGEHTGLFA